MKAEIKYHEDLELNGVYVAGNNEQRFDIKIVNGRFASIEKSVLSPKRTGHDVWITPGVIDLHTHLAWTDFHHEDQLKRSAEEVEALQVKAFEATLRGGVTTARDACGLSHELVKRINQHYGQPLHVFVSGDPLRAPDAAQGLEHLERRVKEIAHSGSSWVKIFATGGLGAPSDKVLDPLFTLEQISRIVDIAHANQLKVLVHTYGGLTLDWSIDAGVDSIEHGIYLTDQQAFRLAQKNIPLIPTAAIYRIAADPHGAFALDEVFRDRASRAAEAHAKSVSIAKKEGVRIGIGTDLASPALHGRNLVELEVLMDYGLTREEVWRSATEIGADILGLGDKLGRIKQGYTADTVIFHADPYEAPNTDALIKSITAVVVGEL